MTTSNGPYRVTVRSAATIAAKTSSWSCWASSPKIPTTTPERIVGEGDDVVVVTKITAGGDLELQADVLTYRGGKLVKAVSIADTALQERVFGTK